MADSFRVAILGAGRSGVLHARAYAQAGGYKLESVCDLIPARSEALRKEFPSLRDADSVEAVLKDPGIDVVSICLPNDLHANLAVKALRAKKHVVVESPPALDAKGMRAMLRAAETAIEKSGSILLPAFPRHHGPHESAARQAVQKGYIGQPLHARATWLRPGGIPQGARSATDPTGWYTDPNRSGGGALLDLGLPSLEVAWSLLGWPKPLTATAVLGKSLAKLPVEESATALIRFEGGVSLELSVAWVSHLPPSQHGVTCRVSGTAGSLDVYTPDGAVLYRGDPAKPKPTALKGPKLTHHTALMRELRTLAAHNEPEPKLAAARRALTLMRIVEAAYRSAESGKSAEVKD